MYLNKTQPEKNVSLFYQQEKCQRFVNNCHYDSDLTDGTFAVTQSDPVNSCYRYGTTAGMDAVCHCRILAPLLSFFMCCHCKPSLFRCVKQAHKHSVHIQTSEA